jgi:hypothetical protein
MSRLKKINHKVLAKMRLDSKEDLLKRIEYENKALATLINEGEKDPSYKNSCWYKNFMITITDNLADWKEALKLF